MLEHSCRKTKGKNFIRDSVKLMERHKHLVPRCRESIKRDYDDFIKFMDGLRNCIEKGICQVLQTRRVIIDKSDCVFRPGKKYTYQYDNNKDQISFYIQEFTLKALANETREEELERDILNDVIGDFYLILITTGGTLADADNEHVLDMNYSGSVSFLDFLRLSFIYNHIINGGFWNIKICASSKCKKLFVSKINGEIRGKYCTQKCYKDDLPKNIIEMRKCQNKMRVFYENFINRHSQFVDISSVGDINLSIRSNKCTQCKYKDSPSKSVKGDCWQLLSNSRLSTLIDMVNKQTQIP